MDVDKAIATVVKTGKVVFGAKEASESARSGKAKLVILANNVPNKIREDIEYYGMLSQIPVLIYRSNNVDLGVISGRRYAVSALTIKESGDSDILKWAEISDTEQSSNDEVGEI